MLKFYFLPLSSFSCSCIWLLLLVYTITCKVAFTPLEPPSPTLEAGPFRPRGYFRRASTFMGKFSGYCFKLDDRGLGYYRDPSQGPAWYDQLQPSPNHPSDATGKNPFDVWSPLQPLFNVEGGAVPKPYYQQTPGHKSPSSLKAANNSGNSPRASPTNRMSPTTSRYASGSENFNSMNATQFDEFAITQQPNNPSSNRTGGSFSKGTHQYLPLPNNEQEAYDVLIASACSAFERMAMGVVHFYNLVNKMKRFFVTPNEITA